MKILFNTYSTAFQNPGGGEEVLLRLRDHLEQKGMTVDLYSKWSHKLKDYDIIHHFSLLEYQQFLAYHSYKAPHGKIVCTPTAWPRESSFYIARYKLKEKCKKLLSPGYFSPQDALQMADLILPTTSLEKERLIKHYSISPEKFQVLPNGIEKPKREVNNAFVEQFKVKDFYLFVGNISPVKNIHRLIKAMKDSPTKLVIIGGPSQEHQDYLKACQKEANENTLFTGPLYDKDLLDSAYKNARGTIIPSEFETCSLVGLESLARGTPLIITERGGTKEVFGEHALYINPDQNDDYKRAVHALESLSREEVTQAQDKILKNYSWDKITERLITFYQNI